MSDTRPEDAPLVTIDEAIQILRNAIEELTRLTELPRHLWEPLPPSPYEPPQLGGVGEGWHCGTVWHNNDGTTDIVHCDHVKQEGA